MMGSKSLSEMSAGARISNTPFTSLALTVFLRLVLRVILIGYSILRYLMLRLLCHVPETYESSPLQDRKGRYPARITGLMSNIPMTQKGTMT